MTSPALTLVSILRRVGKSIMEKKSSSNFLDGVKSLLLCTGLSSFLVKLASNKLVVAGQIKLKQPLNPSNVFCALVPMLAGGARYEGISLLATHF